MFVFQNREYDPNWEPTLKNKFKIPISTSNGSLQADPGKQALIDFVANLTALPKEQIASTMGKTKMDEIILARMDLHVASSLNDMFGHGSEPRLLQSITDLKHTIHAFESDEFSGANRNAWSADDAKVVIALYMVDISAIKYNQSKNENDLDLEKEFPRLYALLRDPNTTKEQLNSELDNIIKSRSELSQK